jgi:hypothetical protein
MVILESLDSIYSPCQHRMLLANEVCYGRDMFEWDGINMMMKELTK